MSDAQISVKNPSRNTKLLLVCFVVGSGLIFFFSNPRPQNYFDYTFRVAENILHGRVGFALQPPSWLNEFVPFENFYYSVFPLGSVLTMVPFAALKVVGIVSEMPAALISALTASGIGLFLLLISAKYQYSWRKRVLLAAGILFGSWMWTNLAMAGAWQLALGFAMLGELGAIYYTVYHRKPLLAGFFFALAFGNRTEILLTAPIFMFLLIKFQVAGFKSQVGNQSSDLERKSAEPSIANNRRQRLGVWNLSFETIKNLAAFCAVPFVLGIETLVYNYIRFHSFTDFGYARIPGVLSEPWYRHGIFSFYYIPQNFIEMLYTPWKRVAGFPFLVPNGFGGSIWWSSPFILCSLYFGARNKILKYTAWTAIFILTLLLWTHGNAGGWQFSYRYAMI
ncbi:MAG: hypothetical protein LH614_07715, partial [Pyrinomonadaceae bacterium]|nr:hypothetical protein [Pyrinomonadaceae bacterium]